MKLNFKEILFYLCITIPNIIIGKINRNIIYVHWGRGLNNFGDCLSPYILKHYGLTPVYVSNNNKSNIILAGTILQWISNNYSGYIVGTGGDNKRYSFPMAKICAVRGKLTLNNVNDSGKSKIILGDPGLLMPYIYKPITQKKYMLGIIPHFVDHNEHFLQLWKQRFKSQRVRFINVLDPPYKVISEIQKCKHIISSSLHGLIIADAYHIPNIRFICRKTMPTKFYDYKFEDYYSSLDCVDTYIEITGKESFDELIEATSLKPQNKIKELQKSLNALMINICNRFKNN